MVSNVGKWDPWYKNIPEDAAPQAYIDTPSYSLGAAWLEDCALVEDWGCGTGYLRNFVESDRYRGIDGTASPFCDEVVDLTKYTSEVEGIFMRGVIEHNYEWSKVLTNAMNSFTKKMSLILFTPMSEETHELDFIEQIGVPDMSFSHNDIISHLPKESRAKFVDIKSETYYGTERIYYIRKGPLAK